ncbi:MOSC domain-containing protein [Nocardioides sp. P5_C9_2]
MAPPAAPAPPVASVLSVNVGSPAPRSGKKTPTGIGKVPVDRIEVADPGPKRRGPDGEGFSGVAGDFVGSGRHHGGSDQAVYACAREELDHWGRELGRELPDGMFGENLTTVGIDVDASEYGDVWTVGGAVLRVSAPRVPCATFALRMGERAWVRRFAERGRAGTYLAVLEPGTIRPGDTITVRRSGSGLAVPTLLRAWMGDADAAREALGHDDLDEESRAYFTRLLARRS